MVTLYELKKKWPLNGGFIVSAKVDGDYIKYHFMGKVVKCSKEYFFRRYKKVEKMVN